ncbi:MAG: hypothetical protein ACRC1D_05940 [Culicoidibacterales bacterium]
MSTIEYPEPIYTPSTAPFQIIRDIDTFSLIPVTPGGVFIIRDSLDNETQYNSSEALLIVSKPLETYNIIYVLPNNSGRTEKYLTIPADASHTLTVIGRKVTAVPKYKGGTWSSNFDITVDSITNVAEVIPPYGATVSVTYCFGTVCEEHQVTTPLMNFNFLISQIEATNRIRVTHEQNDPEFIYDQISDNMKTDIDPITGSFTIILNWWNSEDGFLLELTRSNGSSSLTRFLLLKTAIHSLTVVNRTSVIATPSSPGGNWTITLPHSIDPVTSIATILNIVPNTSVTTKYCFGNTCSTQNVMTPPLLPVVQVTFPQTNILTMPTIVRPLGDFFVALNPPVLQPGSSFTWITTPTGGYQAGFDIPTGRWVVYGIAPGTYNIEYVVPDPNGVGYPNAIYPLTIVIPPVVNSTFTVSLESKGREGNNNSVIGTPVVSGGVWTVLPSHPFTVDSQSLVVVSGILPNTSISLRYCFGSICTTQNVTTPEAFRKTERGVGLIFGTRPVPSIFNNDFRVISRGDYGTTTIVGGTGFFTIWVYHIIGEPDIIEMERTETLPFEYALTLKKPTGGTIGWSSWNPATFTPGNSWNINKHPGSNVGVLAQTFGGAFPEQEGWHRLDLQIREIGGGLLTSRVFTNINCSWKRTTQNIITTARASYAPGPPAWPIPTFNPGSTGGFDIDTASINGYTEFKIDINGMILNGILLLYFGGRLELETNNGTRKILTGNPVSDLGKVHYQLGPTDYTLQGTLALIKLHKNGSNANRVKAFRFIKE